MPLVPRRRNSPSSSGRKLIADVEAALYDSGPGRRPAQFFDPLELAGVIVSLASLAWQLYESHRQQGEKTSKGELGDETRKDPTFNDVSEDVRERIIVIVVSEIITTDVDVDTINADDD